MHRAAEPQNGTSKMEPNTNAPFKVVRRFASARWALATDVDCDRAQFNDYEVERRYLPVEKRIARASASLIERVVQDQKTTRGTSECDAFHVNHKS